MQTYGNVPGAIALLSTQDASPTGLCPFTLHNPASFAVAAVSLYGTANLKPFVHMKAEATDDV